MFRSLLLMAALTIPGMAVSADSLHDMLRSGQIAEAMDTARAVAMALPNDLEAQETWIDLLLSLGIAGEAQVHYNGLLANDPENPDLHYLAGRAATNPATSKKAYERALRLNPEHPRAHMGLAALHRANGNLQDAARGYQRALLKDESLAEAWGGLLNCYVAVGDVEGARKIAQVAMQSVPHDAEAYLTYAMLTADEAGPILRAAVENVPDDARVHTSLAEQLLREGLVEQARRAARAALQLAPNHPGALLAELFANELAREALDANGLDTLIRARRTEKEDPTAARAAYDGLVADYPKSALAWMSRGRLRAPSDPAGAEKDLRRAMALDADNAEVLGALGLLLRQQGRNGEAWPLLERAVAARPGDAVLTTGLARSLHLGGQPARALTVSKDNLLAHPFDVSVVLTHAHLLTESGKKEEAYRAVSAASDRIQDIRLIMAVGTAARALGRWDEAAKIYEMLARQTGDLNLAETARQIRAEQAASR